MDVKEVLIIGAGIAGCLAALAVAKRNIPVTLVTSSFDQRTYHASFTKPLALDESFTFQEGFMCSRAWEQLQSLWKKSIEELIGQNDAPLDIHKRLQEELKALPHVEWLSHHTALDLLTLESYSTKKADMYKKPACLGAYVYNHDTKLVETLLAKETILATGGAASLFLHSTHLSTIIGEGWAMAQRAGVRLLNIENIQFHPLALFEREKPCFPLPLELLRMGGKLLNLQKSVIEFNSEEQNLALNLYQEVLRYKAEYIWLDLTMLDSIEVKEKFPAVDVYCLSRGYNIAKDPLPVVPAAHYTCGGVAVDRLAQSSLHRLRAIGEVACTGLFYHTRHEETSILESFIWAYTCAEDIAKQIDKFVYYFPAVQEWDKEIVDDSPMLQEDWEILRRVMWSYSGIKKDRQSLEKGVALLEELQRQSERLLSLSIERFHFFNALKISITIIQRLISQLP